jgi:hypothetical protein
MIARTIVDALLPLLELELKYMQEEYAEAFNNILDTDTKQLEEDRVYLSSQEFGTSRYHIVNLVRNGAQIEQTDVSEKWPSRVLIPLDEIPGLIKTLFEWYVQALRAAATDDNPF